MIFVISCILCAYVHILFVRSAKLEIIVFLLCISRLLTETAKQAQGPWGGSGEWTEVEVFSDLVLVQYHIDFSFIYF